MNLDLVFVTYNSSKWIENCFRSIFTLEYDLKQISIYVVDNASTDDTVQKLNWIRSENQSKLNSFEVLALNSNLGFGCGNNYAFHQGHSDIVCFLNIDTELSKDSLAQLVQDIRISPPNTAMWELRQFPYEHPKNYDPVTRETSWCSGAAFAVRRDVYQRVGGFDPYIFMYAEDVDLSWRIRSFGWKIRYVPKAVIYHYSYQEPDIVKPNQYECSLIYNLMLRYRFGNLLDIAEGYARVIIRFFREEPFEGAKKRLLRLFLKHFSMIPHFCSKKAYGNSEAFKPTFLGYDYSIARDGAFYINEFPKTQPLVSIIVRTCGRPAVLRETLCSLRNQTYANLEIVVVEDGAAVSEKMIREEFSDLNIRYAATGEKVGRSKAGNRAMAMASGKYLNFLDDDDLFYADHVEVLVRALEQTDCRAAYSFGFETPITVHSRDPYRYTIHGYKCVHRQQYNAVMLCHHNYIPIQTIMFEKSLFEEYGGLDESVDALEDWDLWVRYSQYTDFACVEKTTSIYRVPYDREIDAKRQKELDDALIEMREKHKGYIQSVSVYDLAMLYEASTEKKRGFHFIRRG